MDSKIIHETTVQAFEGKIHFGEVVMKLIAMGVERYHADLAGLQKTFYGKDGGTHIEKLALHGAPVIADKFDADAVRSTIKMSQQGQIKYPEFLKRVMKAGCLHYEVFIAGKQVIYFGRKGEFHIEKFPQAK